ncbi:hypothetical protein [Mesorhizobium sp. M0118]|uniref:hypothetical protein n=1 Tax=Mesorhizobium sp. M0118 TaxID=2956884 RepID=UPI00333AB3BF
MAFTMNGRLRCGGFVVRRHRPILSANGRHCKADHGRAQERNPKQIHFRLRNWQRDAGYTFELQPTYCQPRTALTARYTQRQLEGGFTDAVSGEAVFDTDGRSGGRSV